VTASHSRIIALATTTVDLATVAPDAHCIFVV
jgi:hypothetical protein